MKKVFNAIKNICTQTLLYIISPFVKKKDNVVIFGSWCGELLIDNPFYLAKEFDKHPEYEMYWVGKPIIKEAVDANFKNIKFLDDKKFSTFIKILKSSAVFHSQTLQGDLPRYNIYKKTCKVHLTHGMPLKKNGADDITHVKLPWRQGLYGQFLGSKIRDDFYLTTSEAFSKCLMSSHEDDIKKVLHFGTPRNDYLVNSTKSDIENIRKKYSQLIGTDLSNKKIVLYAPTFRRLASNNISLFNKNEEAFTKLNELLRSNNAVVLEKKHFVGIQRNGEHDIKVGNNFYILDSIKEINIQELFLIADILICDYSGALIDFTVTQKPQITFAFDYDYYRNVDSGLYFDVEDYAPGDISFSYSEMVKQLEFILINQKNSRNNYQHVKEKFLTYEKGNSSEKIIEFLKNNKYIN